jgi:hypothetical protein
MNQSASEHLTAEQISELLDGPRKDKDDWFHLETCEECRAEFERFSRIRMALSALPDLDPPANEWTAIEAKLDSKEPRINQSVLGFGWYTGPPRFIFGSRQLAAAVVVFAAGVFAGLQLPGPIGFFAENTLQPGLPEPAVQDEIVLNEPTELESQRAPIQQAGTSAFEGAEFEPVRRHEGRSGLLVLRVTPRTAAAKLGLRSGDVVVDAGNLPTRQVPDLIQAINASQGSPFSVRWVRDGREMVKLWPAGKIRPKE